MPCYEILYTLIVAVLCAATCRYFEVPCVRHMLCVTDNSALNVLASWATAVL
jgi:hypothetical protein